jgi:hypothetical protein
MGEMRPVFHGSYTRLPRRRRRRRATVAPAALRDLASGFPRSRLRGLGKTGSLTSINATIAMVGKPALHAA